MRARILIALLALILGAILASLFPARRARAQAGGWFSSCTSWTSRETIVRNGIQYTPKADANGDSTACLGGDGKLYLLAYRKDPTDIGFVPLDGVPVWF